MCRSQAEGGVRCASSTRRQVVRAIKRWRAADSPADRVAAEGPLFAALVEYASWPSGRAELHRYASDAGAAGLYQHEALILTAVRQGVLREAAHRMTLLQVRDHAAVQQRLDTDDCSNATATGTPCLSAPPLDPHLLTVGPGTEQAAVSPRTAVA